MKKRAQEDLLALQKGEAYVKRYLNVSDIEYEPLMRELAMKANSPEELSDLIRNEISSLMYELDLPVEIKEIDWSSPEINEDVLYKFAEDLFKKYHVEKREETK